MLEQQPRVRPLGPHSRKGLEQQLWVVDAVETTHADNERAVVREPQSLARSDLVAGRKPVEIESPAQNLDRHVTAGERAGSAREVRR